MIHKIQKKLTQIKNEIPACDNNLKAMLIFADFLVCKARYHVQFEEYRQYSFYKLRASAKKEYVTEYDVIKVMPDLFNKGEMRHTLDDKAAFNDFFSDLLGREYCIIEKNNEEQFLNFISEKEKIVVKPTNSWCGHGVRKIDIPADMEVKKAIYEELSANYQDFLVEECFVQHKDIDGLNPDSVNTIRMISMIDPEGTVHIPLASIRIGRKGSSVDNFCAGGMAAAIDVDSGIIISHAFDGRGQCFFVHPDTKAQIIGFKIPDWQNVIDTVKNAASRIPTMRFVGWDVVIRQDGKVCLIEGNSNPGARTLQLPLRKGIKNIYHTYLGEF